MLNQFEEQLTKIKRQKKLFIALILFFVVLLCWILLSIFASQTQHVVETELIQLAQPLVPNLDQELLVELQDKDYFTEEELENFSIYALLSDRGEDAGKIIDIVNESRVAEDELLEQETENTESETSEEETVEEYSLENLLE